MEDIAGNYRIRKIGDRYLVTSDHGSYLFLDKNELVELKQCKPGEKLRKKLRDKEILLNQSNITRAMKLMKRRNHFLFSGTSLHIVVITLRCDMSCVYCHASSKPKELKEYDMDEDTAKKTVDFIFQSPNKNITIEFQGGEPLLNWRIVKFIVDYATEKNKTANKKLFMTMVTNLSKMDEEKMHFLIDNNVDVCTSLDGPKRLHDMNRPFMEGSNYDIVTKWIKEFKAEYNKKGENDKGINALVTLTKESLKLPQEIVDEYVSQGLKNIHLRFLNNLGVAKNSWKNISYSVEDYLDFWTRCVEYIEKLNEQGKEISERMVSIMTSKISTEYDPNFLDLRSPCGAAIGQLAYNFNGDIYTCDEARMINDDLFLLGNVVKDSYKNIVTCDKACATVASSINDQYICDDCAYKPYCGICPVCNYAEQGSVIAKICETARCKIYMGQFDWVIKEKFLNMDSSNGQLTKK